MFALRTARSNGSAPQRVVVFLDYQNVYHRARDAFCARDAAASEGQVDPLALGRLLAGVRVCRGRPSQRRDSRSYAVHQRQTAKQVSRGEELVTVIARDLRYPPDWPRRSAQEKGIDVALAVDFVMMVARCDYDVGILFSSEPTWCRPWCKSAGRPAPHSPPKHPNSRRSIAGTASFQPAATPALVSLSAGA